MKHVAIIGNGIAGITAARYIRKLSDYRITVISAESKYFWSRTALMYIYMGHMRYHHTKPYEDWFWPKNRIDLVHDYVEDVDPENNQLTMRNGSNINYDTLIIASGSVHNTFGWKGEGFKGVSGMISLQDLERIEHYTQGIDRGVIVGGGLLGIELAEMLLSRNIKVTFLVREKSFWNHILPPEESAMVNKNMQVHNVDLKLSTELDEVIGDKDGRVKAVRTKSGEEISCQFVGLTAGVKPRVNFLHNSGIEIDRGILVDKFLKTNISNIYAIGDCAQHRDPPADRNPIEQIWYTGRIQGETVAKTICGHPAPYQPGVFFNSAKFFNIEYQTYGKVPTEETDELTSFYWKHPKEDKALRVVFYKNDYRVAGFNLMGIRYRQEVCSKWISTGTTIDKVMYELERANFDPEFHRKYESNIRSSFREQFPDMDIKPDKKRKKILGIF